MEEIISVKVNDKDHPMNLLFGVKSNDTDSYCIYSSEDEENYLIFNVVKTSEGILECKLFLNKTQLQEFLGFSLYLVGVTSNGTVKELIQKMTAKILEGEYKPLGNNAFVSKMKDVIEKWNLT